MRAKGVRVVAVASVAVLMSLTGFAAAAVAEDEDPSGGGAYTITVTVNDAVPSPSDSPSPTSSQSGSGSSRGGNGSGSSNGGSGEIPPSTEPTPGPSEFSVGGALFVSGLTTSYVPSLNPLGGWVKAHFTVRNVSTSTISSRVEFSLYSFSGLQLSDVRAHHTLRLKPNETQVVEAALGGPGQWAIANATFTLTPLTKVDGAKLLPLSREAIVIFPPWLLLMIVGLTITGYVVVRAAMAERSPEPLRSFA